MSRLLLILAVSFAVCSVSSWAADGKFPFVVPTFDDSKTVVDLSWMNDKPAGGKGFVAIKNGHFVDGAGERLRFLGVNLCFGACFPRHEDAEKVARRMAKLGINCVRFHHMDNGFAPRGMWDKRFKDKQHIDPDQLDRLDYLFFQLKQNGIYADLNLHVSRTLTEEDGLPTSPNESHRYNKALDNFEPKMIQLQKIYARDLLTHVNPYTKTRYVDEPAVAIVEINNENSLMSHALGNSLEPMPEYYGQQLNKLWREWLKTRYASTAELRKAWNEIDEPLGPQMLANGDFTKGTEAWVLEAPKPAEAEMKAVPQGPEGAPSLYAKMTKPGERSWHFQIHQVHMDFAEGQVYTVSFRAKSNKAATIRVNARFDHDPWTNIGLDQPCSLSDRWQAYTFVFRAKAPAKDGNRLSFTLTNEPSEFWFADVKVQKGGFIGLDKQCSLEAGNIVRPVGPTSQGIRRDYLSFLMEMEKRYTTEMHRYLKEDLGLHAHVIDTQASYGGLAGVLRESRMDFADNHAYWEHPRFPGRPWDSNNWNIPNTSMVRAPGRDTLTRLAQCRLAGRPYTVTEYNHPAPNDYSAECVPMVASFAALQDWDGIFLFAYVHRQDDWEPKRICSYFDIDTHPAKIMMMPTGAAMFRRGDVSPARGEMRLTVPESQVTGQAAKNGADVGAAWKECGVERTEAIRQRLSVALSGGWGTMQAGPASPLDGLLDAFVGVASMPLQLLQPRDKESAARFLSDTAEVDWDLRQEGAELYTVNAPSAKAIVGFAGGRAVQVGALTAAIRNTFRDFAAVSLVAMDGKPVERSDRLLLTAIANVENTEMGWDEKRTTLGKNWGKEPTLAEGVEGVISLACEGRPAEVFALDPSGARTTAVPIRLEEGDLRFQIGPAFKTLWYEISFPEKRDAK